MNRDFKFRLYDNISKHYYDNDSFLIGRCVEGESREMFCLNDIIEVLGNCHEVENICKVVMHNE